MIVKKIIKDEVYLQKFSRQTYEANREVDLPYFAGKFNDLIPSDFKNNANSNIIDRKYINESMLFNETIDVGNKGLYYFVLQKGYKIDQLLFQPDEIIVDLFIHKDGRLIYSFYNSTQKTNIIIKGKITNDIEKIAERLKSNLTDVAFREYFIKLAIEDFGKEIKIPEYYPSIMTSNQVALYLNLAEKTIRKLTSEKKIPVTKIGGSARYRKEDLDLFLKNNTTHPNKTKNK